MPGKTVEPNFSATMELLLHFRGYVRVSRQESLADSVKKQQQKTHNLIFHFNRLSI